MEQLEHYYEVLELPIYASKKDIKDAYRRLAKTWHPDINKSANAETMFKQINEAYEYLMNLPEDTSAFSAEKTTFNYLKTKYAKLAPWYEGTSIDKRINEELAFYVDQLNATNGDIEEINKIINKFMATHHYLAIDCLLLDKLLPTTNNKIGVCREFIRGTLKYNYSPYDSLSGFIKPSVTYNLEDQKMMFPFGTLYDLYPTNQKAILTDAFARKTLNGSIYFDGSTNEFVTNHFVEKNKRSYYANYGVCSTIDGIIKRMKKDGYKTGLEFFKSEGQSIYDLTGIKADMYLKAKKEILEGN